MDELTGATRCGRAGLLVCCALWSLCGLTQSGCESLGTTKKFKNPVVPPPPQRIISRADDDADGSAADSDGRPKLAQGDERGSKAGAGRDSLTGDEVEARSSNRTARVSAPRPMSRGERPADGPGHAPGPESAENSEIEQVGGTEATGRGWKSSGAAYRSITDGSLPPSEDRQKELTAANRTTETDVDSLRIEHGEVAATVNGVPIFVNDVLHDHRITQWLEQVRKGGWPPEKIREARIEMVKQRLPGFIQQELLVQALKRKVPDNQLDKMLESLDKQFDTEALPLLMKEVGVSTPGELASKLEEIDRSLESERRKYCSQQMAQQYVAMTAKPYSGFDRPDIVDHYRQNHEKFLVQGEVKWQQIRLSFGRRGRDQQKTRQLAQEILDRLQAGEDFAELAKKYSDGATAATGGVWDWTKEGSLASEELDEALFSMPVGDELAMIESDKAIDIVLVLDRHERGRKSFHSVQHDIHNELRQTQVQRNVQELLKDLEAKAHIEKYTDRM